MKPRVISMLFPLDEVDAKRDEGWTYISLENVSPIEVRARMERPVPDDEPFDTSDIE